MYWICKKHDKSGNIGICPDCETQDMLNELKTKMKVEANSSQFEPQVIKKNAEGLLPCPFCGRKPRLEGTQPFLINEQKQTFRFICDCRCTVIDSVEKARDYWNKRK